MNIEQLNTKFQLYQLPESSHLFRFAGQVKQSAVLVAITEIEQHLQLILTKRAVHLKHHAGQVSFAGGKVDRQDSSIQAAALREAQEEIGLAPSQVNIIGQLRPYQTISGYVIHPVLATVEQPTRYQINQAEVAEVFHVPLSHILDQNNHISIDTEHNKRRYSVTYIPYQEYNIWGATAAILKDLSHHLG